MTLPASQGTFLLLRVVTGLSRTTSVQFIGCVPRPRMRPRSSARRA